MYNASGSSFGRRIASLFDLWRGLSVPFRVLDRSVRDSNISEEEAEAIRQQMRECLEARGGDVSARVRTASLMRTYLSLSLAGRKRFLQVLACEFAVDRACLSDAVLDYHTALDDRAILEGQARLREVLIPPRLRLLTQFNSLPDGIKLLVDMRKELLACAGEDPWLDSLEADLRGLLASWFDVGFLELRRIAWDSPASLLEKLATYEAVHEVRSWADLKNRLDADRRCYGFFHARMPDEPLIFVEVALVRGMAGNVQALLDESAPTLDPRQADTAIFYSISNTQDGLRGISFGNFLIKKVVDDLAGEFPQIDTFATLSPVAGFIAWLDQVGADELRRLVRGKDHDALERLCRRQGIHGDFRSLLRSAGWHNIPAITSALEQPLTRLCAQYLLAAKKQERPVDPVARFHLGNGASVERINWLGNTSEKGLRQSAGLMVNYRYRLEEIEANHERYASHGAIAASTAVRRLIGRGGGSAGGGPAEESWLRRALKFARRKELHGDHQTCGAGQRP
jgi:malonyl-CoA decarboxylase